jgi:hypothetical protein
VTAEEAYRRVAEKLPPDFAGRFFSPGTAVGLGKGKIYDQVSFPLFDPATRTFATVEGLAYVVTHECDVDGDNERIFSEDVLVCPILGLERLVALYLDEVGEERLISFLGSLGNKEVSRVVFLPPISQAVIPYGGVLYLNQITNTPRSTFEGAKEICAVTAFGLRHIEYILENHLLRPKADRLAFDSEGEGQ